MLIGVIGLGRMGLAITKRLTAQAKDCVAWDIDPERVSAASNEGVKIAKNAADVTRQAEVIISIVTDDAAVRHLFEAPDGLLAGNPAGRIFIEMSTLQPATVRELGEKVSAAGARFVGAPILGSVPTVHEGKLFVLAGGAPEDIVRARAVLAPLAREVLAVGSLGSGNAMKLVVNLTMAAYLEALAEGLALGARHSLTLDMMLSVLAQAPTANPWLQMKAPILKGQGGPISLDITTLQKDIMSAVAAGSILGVPMPMAGAILAALSAAVAAGHGHEDLAELPRFFRDAMLRPSATGE